VRIPTLTGVQQTVAEDQLKNMNLLTKVELVENEQAQGTVLGTVPAANSDVPEGSEVTIRVSKGNLKLVPTVAGRGYTEGEARAALNQAGFPNTSIEVVNAPVTKEAEGGKVILQDPAPNTAKDPATTRIRITVGTYTATSSSTASPAPSSTSP
jgi:serine/threonine-protein kinase